MPEVPFHLVYRLSRAQRLVPFLRFWGWGWVLFVIALELFFAVNAGVSLAYLSLPGTVTFGGLALGGWLLYRGMFAGLRDVLVTPVREMDVIVEESVAGILESTERWYLFLDGIQDLRKYREDVWTVRHWNGVVFHIAADAITEEQLDHIRAAMAWGRTPEGIQAVIERGKLIERLQ